MREATVWLGPGRGHRLVITSSSTLGALRERARLALGCYEREAIAFASEWLPRSRVFFDVGAYTGYYTRIALRLMDRTGLVVAFEPDRDLAAVLRSSFDDSRLRVCTEALGRDEQEATLDSRLRVCTEALGRDEQEAGLPRRAGLAACNAGASISARGFSAHATVQVRPLDAFIEAGKVPAPDMIKIDVEGGELLALEGMGRLLGAHPTLIVECHSMALLADVVRLLSDHAYERLQVTRGGDLVGPPFVLASQA